jgi:hypothetical protein
LENSKEEGRESAVVVVHARVANDALELLWPPTKKWRSGAREM